MVETGEQTSRFGLVNCFVLGRVGQQEDAERLSKIERQNKKVKTPTLPRTREEWGTQKARKREAKSKAKESKAIPRHTTRNGCATLFVAEGDHGIYGHAAAGGE